jgi:hypothetical protein
MGMMARLKKKSCLGKTFLIRGVGGVEPLSKVLPTLSHLCLPYQIIHRFEDEVPSRPGSNTHFFMEFTH